VVARNLAQLHNRHAKSVLLLLVILGGLLLVTLGLLLVTLVLPKLLLNLFLKFSSCLKESSEGALSILRCTAGVVFTFWLSVSAGISMLCVSLRDFI